ncbi:MAG: hypothetical protein mread185_000264 [Mycoplasmataceae bacterium]|nr:MAG: hypothetical protein mread185_000264 [Mycoplasmataceae bacterium]
MAEYLAIITGEQKTTNKNVWKYNFVDTKTNKGDFFLNNYRINYIPNLKGELKLFESDNHPKFYEDFQQDVANFDEKLFQQEATIKLSRGLEREIAATEKRFSKKRINLIERSKHLISLRSQKEFTQKEIARVYNKSTRTIRRWEKPRLIFQRAGRKPVMTNYHLILLIDHVFKCPKLFQQERIDYIFAKTDQSYSQQVISLNLKRLGLHRKVIPYYYTQQKALMYEYWKFVSEIIPNLPPHLLLALDESGFSTNLGLRYGYAPTWNRVKADKPGWGINYSLISLIHNVEKNGIVHAELIEGTVDAEVFHNFLTNFELPTNEEYYLLMDNIRFHKTEKIEKFLKQKKINPIYIVAHFPQLNPTEWFFNTVKHNVKKLPPRTKEALENILAEIIKELQGEDMTKYFKNCLDFKID